MPFRLMLFLFIVLSSSATTAQDIKGFIQGKQWILVTEKAEKSTSLTFLPYAKDKITLNTMIWTFLPNGRITYDYQSSDDVEACLGVDFLDLDVDACIWKFNISSNSVLLTLKGGYASIDDFILKNEYDFQTFEGENQEMGFELILKKKVYFRNIN
jgi:hypothetical protein